MTNIDSSKALLVLALVAFQPLQSAQASGLTSQSKPVSNRMQQPAADTSSFLMPMENTIPMPAPVSVDGHAEKGLFDVIKDLGRGPAWSTHPGPGTWLANFTCNTAAATMHTAVKGTRFVVGSSVDLLRKTNPFPLAQNQFKNSDQLPKTSFLDSDKQLKQLTTQPAWYTSRTKTD